MHEEKAIAKLHTNQRLLLQELVRRGVKVEVLVPELEIARATYGKHVELFLDRNSSRCPYASSLIAADKYTTKNLLKEAKLAVPRGEQFFCDQKTDILRCAAAMIFPLVLKPSSGSHGERCMTDIGTIEELEEALDSYAVVSGKDLPLLLEEQFDGAEYRVFITKYGDHAVLRRDPAAVIGDGMHSISSLIQRENYRRTHPRDGALCPIVLDARVPAHLERNGLTLESVPTAGRKVSLRRASNLVLGGTPADCTAEVHPSLITIAKRALAAIPGLSYAGVDIISRDAMVPQSKESYRVLEVNSNPGLHMHEQPSTGICQPVASYLADVIFPELRVARRRKDG